MFPLLGVDAMSKPKRRWGTTLISCVKNMCKNMHGSTKLGCAVKQCHAG